MKEVIKEINKLIRECNDRLRHGHSIGYVDGLKNGLQEAKKVIKKYD